MGSYCTIIHKRKNFYFAALPRAPVLAPKSLQTAPERQEHQSEQISANPGSLIILGSGCISGGFAPDDEAYWDLPCKTIRGRT